MGLKKFGTGDGRVTETEGHEGQSIQREASAGWTANDREDLARENAQADGLETDEG